MTRRRSGMLSAAIWMACTLGALDAAAQPFFNGSAPIVRTTYSGWAGTLTETDTPTMHEGGKAGIFAIDWREEGNQPCYIGVYSRTLTEKTEVYTNSNSNFCNGSPGDRKEVGFADNPRYWVRGVAVCSSKTGNSKRLKGVRFYATKVWLERDDVEELTTVVEEDQANCGTWNAPVYCPAEHAAVGLLIHRDGKSITGLGLRCMAVLYD